MKSTLKKMQVCTYRYGQGHGVQLSFAQVAAEDGAHHTDQEPQKLCHKLRRNGVRGYCRDSRLWLLTALHPIHLNILYTYSIIKPTSFLLTLLFLVWSLTKRWEKTILFVHRFWCLPKIEMQKSCMHCFPILFFVGGGVFFNFTKMSSTESGVMCF